MLSSFKKCHLLQREHLLPVRGFSLSEQQLIVNFVHIFIIYLYYIDSCSGFVALKRSYFVYLNASPFRSDSFSAV